MVILALGLLALLVLCLPNTSASPTIVGSVDMDLNSTHIVWLNATADPEPTPSELKGTGLGEGTAIITSIPEKGIKGTYVVVTGSGFSTNGNAQVLFGGVPIGLGTSDDQGNLIPVGVVIPQVSAGAFELTVIDDNGVYGVDSFTVIDDTPIDITVDVGALHFNGEMVSIYATTTINGNLVDVDYLNATLYAPDGSEIDLSCTATRISTGVYLFSTTVPMTAGTGDHAMVLNASKSSTHHGASVSAFVISPTLSGLGATLSDIKNDTATVITTLGSIRIDLSKVNATVISIQGKIIEVGTVLGTVEGTLDQIHGTVISINGTVVRLRTDLGIVNSTVNHLHAHIIAMQGTLATIETDLGYVNVTIAGIHATVSEVQGRLATVQTDLGSINVTVNDIHAQIMAVQGNLAVVQTDLGAMNVSMSAIHGQVETIQGTVAVIITDLGSINSTVESIHSSVMGINDDLIQINTTLGIVQTNLSSVNAKLDGLNGTVATIRTDIGPINASLTDIRFRIVALEGDSATIASTVGSIQGTVTGMNGTVATIDTNMGEALVDIGAIQNKANGIDTSTLFGAGIFTVLAIIILMVVILRTRKR